MDTQARVTTDLRLAELMAAISLATDLGNGYPLEKAMRDTLVAVGLARELGLDGQDLSDVYYLSLLEHLGCTAVSHEVAAKFGGDDNGLRSLTLTGDPKIVRRGVREWAKHSRAVDVVTVLARSMVTGRRYVAENYVAICDAATRLADRLALSPGVRRGLLHVYARWDGKGLSPIKGEEIAVPARIVRMAFLVEIYHRLGGRELATEMVRHRSGHELDPAIARVFVRNADLLLSPIEAESVWEAALEVEPEPRPWLPESRLDGVAQAFADFVDLKSPYTLGHSSEVSRIAEAAAKGLGLPGTDVVALRRAGLVHDIGRVSVPNGIWDKRGPLTGAEHERVRLHPYYTERILAHSSMLQPLAQLASMHHERLNGSGYHRAVAAAAIGKPARLLAAADAYQAMTEERPHRAALARQLAADQLCEEARQGRLDQEAVNAVLGAVGGQRPKQRSAWPAQLSDREVEVLRLVARAKTDKQIGRQLFISPNTVHHHVKQIYEKIGVSSRAGAALFAMEHDLLSS